MKIRSETGGQYSVTAEGVNSIRGAAVSLPPAWRILRKPLPYPADDADVFGTGSGDNGGCGTNGPALEKTIVPK